MCIYIYIYIYMFLTRGRLVVFTTSYNVRPSCEELLTGGGLICPVFICPCGALSSLRDVLTLVLLLGCVCSGRALGVRAGESLHRVALGWFSSGARTDARDQPSLSLRRAASRRVSCLRLLHGDFLFT